MYDRRNRYLEDRARRKSDMARGRDYRSRAGNGYLNDAEIQYQMGMRDGRNPYGAKGGYVSSDRANRGNDYAMDYRNGYAERDRGYDYRGNSDYRGQDYARGNQYSGQRDRNMDYEMYGYGMIQPMHYDYTRGRDYNYERDYDNMEKEYHEELKKWTEKLHKKDTRIRVNKDQIIRQAKNMNVRFNDYTEDEFYAVYLMMIANYPNVTNDYNVYLSMAKNWLEDDDVYYKGGDKVCSYLYHTVLGK